MFDTVITDTFALQRHYIFREGYIFTAMTEPANVYDAIVIRHPSDCDCWTPKLGHSSRTLDEHIRFINEHHITKAIIIAESIDFIRQCPSLHELMIIPADSAPVPFSYIPLYHSDIHYLDCRTSYGGSTEPFHTEIDYSHFPQLEGLRLFGRGHKNYEELKNLETLWISKMPEIKAFPSLKSFYTLKYINIFQCGLTSLTGIADFSELRSIDLSYNRSLSTLNDLVHISLNLKELTIMNCPKIHDYSFLSKLTNLRVLNLIGNNKIPDLSFLEQMSQLDTFRFSMDVVNGDLSLCQNIRNVKCLRHRNHYNR